MKTPEQISEHFIQSLKGRVLMSDHALIMAELTTMVSLAINEAYERAALVVDDYGETWGLGYVTMTSPIAESIRSLKGIS